MGTLVCFHAHPDDESISTGGSLARASAEGHRVVLVIATDGSHGESPDDLAEDELLVDRRRAETAESAAALGVHRVEWLGYKDSGMTGWEQNSDPESFLQAPVEEAAEKLAEILREEHADVLTVYDWHGNYGHPDHIKVHTVGHRAAEMAGVERVFEATMNRDHIVRMMEAARRGRGRLPRRTTSIPTPVPTTATRWECRKPRSPTPSTCRHTSARNANRCAPTAARSPTPASSSTCRRKRSPSALGTEWFILKGADPGPRPGWLFE